jgi:endonuclease/exonuclease/phosphatase family metal-dependent hydrolase
MSTSERILATEQPGTGGRSADRNWPLVGLIASSLVILMEVLRTLYPLGYALVGDLGFVVTPLVLLTVFLAPLMVLATRPLRGRTRLTGGVVALAATRLALQLGTPGLSTAAIATVVALVGVTLVLSDVFNREHGASAVALGAVVAAGSDAALKSAFAAWDRVWQPGWWPMLVTVGVCITLTAFGVATARLGTPPDLEPRRGRLGRMFTVAVLLMPMMTMVASVAYIGSSSGRSLPTTALATVGGAALAVLATSTAAAAHIDRRGALVAAAALSVVVYSMTHATGVTVLVLAAVGQCLIGVLLVGVLLDEPTDRVRHGSTGGALGATLGFVTMFALTLLHPLHYEMPLPIGNTWMPSIAVGLSALGLLAARAPRGMHAAPVVRHDTRWGLAAGMAIAAVGVAGALAMAAHEPVRTVAADPPLRVATFNIDQAAGDDGAIDFTAAADLIDALDADIVALQEVGRGWSLSGMNDFAAWLEQSRGFAFHVVPAADRQFVNMLITRVDISSVHGVQLPQGAGSMRRSAIVAEVPHPDGPITVIATHLQHRNTVAGIEARELELEAIIEVWAEAPRTILLGDFNVDNRSAPDGGPKLLVSEEHQFTLQPLIDVGFVTTQPTERCTQPTSNDNCSDYVLVTPDLRLDPPVEVLDPAAVGDHRPVVGIVTAT